MMHSQVVSREHILTAIYQALQAGAGASLRTRTVHSEVLLALHPSNNVSTNDLLILQLADIDVLRQIADAIKRFGISSSTTSLLLVRIGSPTGTDSEATQEKIDSYQQLLVDQMSELVEGDMVPLQELPSTSDWKAIKKVRGGETGRSGLL